ncbi:hypothetical protein FPV67DRAFT_1449143 [Lyophyllum atratum]|nr:hypothetical protein FPV67DRAFT_1449143 [Lyophyllum atratum]
MDARLYDVTLEKRPEGCLAGSENVSDEHKVDGAGDKGSDRVLGRRQAPGDVELSANGEPVEGEEMESSPEKHLKQRTSENRDLKKKCREVRNAEKESDNETVVERGEKGRKEGQQERRRRTMAVDGGGAWDEAGALHKQ